ncbi:MAG: ATP-dependent DNA helicase RecG [Rubrivivax sp.]|nr:ATP-dependent DNA helicase RecG [Rubrivivax sp.]
MQKLGLRRDIDLALHLPLRYEDETRVLAIAALREGEPAQVEAEVRSARVEPRPRRQLVVRLADASGELVLRFLHFHPALERQLAAGVRIRARGEARTGFFGREMVHPAVRVVVPGTPLPQVLTPVYPTAAGLPQAYLRKAVASALERAPLGELLPPGSVPAGLPAFADALELLHRPPAAAAPAALEDRRHPAWQRLKFDELLAQQLTQLAVRRAHARRAAPRLRASADPGSLRTRLVAALPFTLTAAQCRVVAEIEADLARAQPMHRLLQGDVGAGKTVVAALAAATAIDAGWQCALMAPTEILAEQHFRKLVDWLEPLGAGVAWLTGSRKGRARREQLARIADGTAALVVGTHAVIQEDVGLPRLGLAIVDEQHRFGVAQRLALRRKSAAGDAGTFEPHLLTMSATPIPRTLAMTYYADLDVSTIDELPPGRTPVLTKLVAQARRDEVVARIAGEIALGRQVYWVCPLIDAADDDSEAPPPGGAGVDDGGRAGAARRALAELRNATETQAMLAAALPGREVGLLHGRLPAAGKAAVMSRFVSGAMPVLVATTVIEVGVDVPNASLMVVEHAERFGLAQLHQLRGRVGRGAAASVCVLLYGTPLSDTGKARLKAMAETNDGFEIARRDLAIRGPGELLGARQSGEALLRFADLDADEALLRQARALAPRLLDHHPEAAAAHVERWLGSRAEYLQA